MDAYSATHTAFQSKVEAMMAKMDNTNHPVLKSSRRSARIAELSRGKFVLPAEHTSEYWLERHVTQLMTPGTRLNSAASFIEHLSELFFTDPEIFIEFHMNSLLKGLGHKDLRVYKRSGAFRAGINRLYACLTVLYKSCHYIDILAPSLTMVEIKEMLRILRNIKKARITV